MHTHICTASFNTHTHVLSMTNPGFSIDLSQDSSIDACRGYYYIICVPGMNAVDCFHVLAIISICWQWYWVALVSSSLSLSLCHDLMPWPFCLIEGHHSYWWSINEISLPLAQKWLLLTQNVIWFMNIKLLFVNTTVICHSNHTVNRCPSLDLLATPEKPW
jgi:hypothetical protein